jgi:hypothetical protein
MRFGFCDDLRVPRPLVRSARTARASSASAPSSNAPPRISTTNHARISLRVRSSRAASTRSDSLGAERAAAASRCRRSANADHVSPFGSPRMPVRVSECSAPMRRSASRSACTSTASRSRVSCASFAASMAAASSARSCSISFVIGSKLCPTRSRRRASSRCSACPRRRRGPARGRFSASSRSFAACSCGGAESSAVAQRLRGRRVGSRCPRCSRG